jgi:hypothetical protein
MESSERTVVQTSGGAVFHEISAGRDITISKADFYESGRGYSHSLLDHVSEIRQTVQSIFGLCNACDIPQKLLDELASLRNTAETVERHAQGLQADITSEPQLVAIFDDCKKNSADLKRLMEAMSESEHGSNLTPDQAAQCESDVIRVRLKLLSVQASLNTLDQRRFMQQQAAIQTIIEKYIQKEFDAREPSMRSMESFHTANSISVAESEMWHEFERDLRQYGVTAEQLQNHQVFIREILANAFFGADSGVNLEIELGYQNAMQFPTTSSEQRNNSGAPSSSLASEIASVEPSYDGLPEHISSSNGASHHQFAPESSLNYISSSMNATNQSSMPGVTSRTSMRPISSAIEISPQGITVLVDPTDPVVE